MSPDQAVEIHVSPAGTCVYSVLEIFRFTMPVRSSSALRAAPICR
jgi:hypothetical protein